jgi:hypothetical protein
MRISTVSFVAAAISLTSGIALADDTKMYPGAACATDAGATSRWMGRAYNTTSAPQQLECPIVKDARRISYAAVYVADANSTAGAPGSEFDFTCTLYSTNLSLINPVSGVFETVRGERFGHQTLEFPTSRFINIDPGAYQLWCQAPAKLAIPDGESQLIGYKIVEAE